MTKTIFYANVNKKKKSSKKYESCVDLKPML